MYYFRQIFTITILVALAACNSGKSKKVSAENTGDRKIKYAERFDIIHRDGNTVLTIINPWQGAKNINQTYYLVPEGGKEPEGVDPFNIIRTPVKSIICMSTTHLSMVEALHGEERIKGISGVDFIYDRKLIDMVSAKKIVDVGYEDNLNKELVLKISPDLVIVYGIGNESEGYLNKLKELGIKVLYDADYLETNPLGKAEWLKVFAALFAMEKEGDSLFLSIADEYNSITSYVEKSISARPSVFLGLPWKDTWFISPGNSYISRIISDAGGEYLWKDAQSEVSMPYGIENVYLKAIKADFWLNSSSAASLTEIASMDNRLKDLPSFKNHKVFNNNKRVNIKGGNDYWESGSTKPQVILKDIASILHPELFPGYEKFYYKQLE
jgi:iron complex transport system substrate-binding protein